MHSVGECRLTGTGRRIYAMAKHRYLATAINVIRAKDGRVYPKAPAGMAVPKGWKLTEDGEGYERE